jgi:hypothetical protein
MTHTNYRLSITQPLAARLFAVAVAAAGMLGCTGEATSDPETQKVSSASVADPHEIMIHYLDDRVATSFHIDIATVDQSNGGFYAGNAWVPGPVTGGTNGANFMLWNQTGLSEEPTTGGPAYDQDASWLAIIDTSTAPHRFSTMRVRVQVTINGECYSDYEDVDITQPVDLDFTGWGARLDGCWVGDILTHHVE